VRDEKGRRRLHGAFTGGFSAGYFNSVGSKEGWTPSNFVSSRSARANKKQARPEDFMDEEDLAEMRDSQKLMDTTESRHDTFGAGQGVAAEDDLLSSAIQNLVPPITDSPGANLLRKMGWRPGQGVGPRISYAKLKQQDAQLSGALSKPTLPKKPDILDEEAVKHTFAPRDTNIPAYPTKDDNFGLGYRRGPGLVSTVAAGQTTGRASSGPKISAGFGLGALNDADEDDLDIYDHGDESSNRRRLAFDADDDEEVVTIGQTSRNALQTRSITNKSTETFHDGRALPSGFTLAVKSEIEDSWFEPPEVPKGWKPDPGKIWASFTGTAASGKGQENVPPTTGGQLPTVLDTKGRRQPAITADQRGALLGESPLPAAPKSVFDYLSTKDRERLQAFSKARQSGAPEKPSAPPVTATEERNGSTSGPTVPESDRPSLHPSVAKAAMAGYKPFTTDPPKQARYDVFLRYHASPTPSTPYLARLATQSAEEFAKELSDFAKAAMIFKPATGAMANRFMTASVLDTGPKIIEGLRIPEVKPDEDIANIGLGEDETQGRDTLTYERPSMDIFKAIFASDDEDEGSDNEDTNKDGDVEDGDANTPKPAVSNDTAEDTSSRMDVDDRPPQPPPDDKGMADSALFRPTFVSRAKREGVSTSDSAKESSKGKGKEKAKDKDKKKKKPVLVSFGGDDEMSVDDPANPASPTKPSVKKRKRDKESKTKRDEGGDVEMEWVEKEVAPIPAPASVGSEVRDSGGAGGRAGRKTAADFM
ncbi:hypothetical protein FRB99_007394, partial [Tulasnella sp. 403]